jgi:hypothetical protein
MTSSFPDIAVFCTEDWPESAIAGAEVVASAAARHDAMIAILRKTVSE